MNFSETYGNDIVKLLYEQPGIDIDSTTKNEEGCALSKAVQRDDNLDMVKFLVEAGADPDMRCDIRKSHLQLATECDQFEVVKYLLSKGAWINMQRCDYATPCGGLHTMED